MNENIEDSGISGNLDVIDLGVGGVKLAITSSWVDNTLELIQHFYNLDDEEIKINRHKIILDYLNTDKYDNIIDKDKIYKKMSENEIYERIN